MTIQIINRDTGDVVAQLYKVTIIDVDDRKNEHINDMLMITTDGVDISYPLNKYTFNLISID